MTHWRHTVINGWGWRRVYWRPSGPPCRLSLFPGVCPLQYQLRPLTQGRPLSSGAPVISSSHQSSAASGQHSTHLSSFFTKIFWGTQRLNHCLRSRPYSRSIPVIGGAWFQSQEMWLQSEHNHDKGEEASGVTERSQINAALHDAVREEEPCWVGTGAKVSQLGAALFPSPWSTRNVWGMWASFCWSQWLKGLPSF